MYILIFNVCSKKLGYYKQKLLEHHADSVTYSEDGHTTQLNFSTFDKYKHALFLMDF